MATKRIENLVKSVNSRLQPLLEFDRFYAALYDPLRSLVEFPWVVQDGKPVEWVTRPYQPTSWLLDSIIHAQAPRLVEQGFEQAFAKDGLKYWPEGDLPQSWLAAPMIAEDRVIGVLVIESRRKLRAFGENGVRVLSTVARQVAVAIENARLVDQRDRKIASLGALYEMGQKLNSGIRLGEAEVLQLIYEQTKPLMDTSNLYIALHDKATDTVSFPLMFVDGPATQVPSRSGGKGRTEWIIQNRAPILNETRAESEAWYRAPGREEYIGEPFASWVGVPMMVGDKVLGVIATYHKTLDYVYAKDDQEILSLMANQAAVAIENARLYEHLEERVRERTAQLAALQVIGVEITSQLELDKALGSIVEHANKLLSADFSTLFPYTPEQEKFEKGIRKGKVEVEPTIPSNEGFSAEVAKNQQPFYASNALVSGLEPEFIANKQIKSFASVPLVIRDRTVGVLHVNFFESHDFSEEEQKTIGMLANQAAVAIENARLYSNLEERVQERTRQLKEMQSEIADRERALVMTSLAMDFVHEINNLAGTIVPWITLAKRLLDSVAGVKNSKAIQYLDNTARDAELMLQKAQEFRNPTMGPEKINVEELVGSVVGQVSIMTSPDIEIVLETEPNLPFIYANERQLSTAIYSVIHNATKAISGQGRVSVELERDQTRENHIKISITDTGCGIPVDNFDAIFEYGTSNWSDGKGFGYGLWRSRSILRNMNGDIQIASSVLGKGSTFTIVLPSGQS